MALEIVLVIGVLGVLVVVAATAVGLVRGRRRTAKAREDLAVAEAHGVQPPSLHPRVDLAKCIGSGTCVDACPEVDVLAVLDGKARVVNPTACIGHGECLRACPVDAIQLVIGSERRGVDIPLVAGDFQTSVPGLYIVGELGGMGLIYNATTQALQCVAGLVRSLPPRVDGVHQVVIVGCGPAGLAASLAAKEAGLDCVTLEQESIGGTVLHYPRHKIVMTRPVKLPLYGPLRITEVRKEALLEVWNDVLAKTGLQVRSGCRVAKVARTGEVFEVALEGGEILRAQRVVLAMGRRGTPRKLGVPGEELGKVTYRLLEPERYAGSRALVVGGGDSAVEAAIALGEAGAVTHLSYRGAVFGRIKPKNQKRLDAAVAEGRVELVLESNVRAIEPEQVVLDEAGAERVLLNDYVIVLAGGVLPTRFLEAAGVEVKSFQGEVFAPAN